MIKIIEPGTLNRVNCKYCGALLSYSREDVKERLVFSKFCEKKVEIIVCPQCQNEVILEAERGLQINKTSK